MSSDPWTSDDPQPGDFDEVIESIDDKHLQVRDGDPEARVRNVDRSAT
jgi:hypothetical protein